MQCDTDSQLLKWLRHLADSQAPPGLSVTLPLQLLAGTREEAAIHVLAAQADRNAPQPACLWRQA